MATNSDLFDKLMKGEVKLHEVNDSSIRLKFLEKKLNLDLKNIYKSIL